VNWAAGFPYLIKQIVFFILIYTLFSIIKNEYNIANYIVAMVCGALVVSISIIYTFLTTDFAIYSLQTLGFAISGGYFANVAAAGGILTVTITLNLYLIITSGKENKTKRLLLLLSLVIQVLALLLTNSRAAILGSFVSTIVFLFSFTKISKLKLLSGIVLTFLIIFTMFPTFLDTFLIFIRAHRIFENPRYNLWSVSFDIISDNPVLGIGPGTFGQYMYKYIPIMLDSWDAVDFNNIYSKATVGHSHNFILFRFTELGLLGFFTSIFLPYLFYKYSFQVLRVFKGTDRKNHVLMLAVLSIGTGLFARSIFESTGLLSHGWITRDLPFWLLFSFVIYHYQQIIVQKSQNLI
jgi:O-antigen ligase